jgi:hypothetical protein
MNKGKKKRGNVCVNPIRLQQIRKIKTETRERQLGLKRLKQTDAVIDRKREVEVGGKKK